MKRFLTILTTCTIFALPLTCRMQGQLPNPTVDINYSPADEPEATEDVVLEFLRDLYDDFGGG